MGNGGTREPDKFEGGFTLIDAIFKVIKVRAALASVCFLRGDELPSDIGLRITDWLATIGLGGIVTSKAEPRLASKVIVLVLDGKLSAVLVSSGSPRMARVIDLNVTLHQFRNLYAHRSEAKWVDTAARPKEVNAVNSVIIADVMRFCVKDRWIV